jgi:hypothetical protein
MKHGLTLLLAGCAIFPVLAAPVRESNVCAFASSSYRGPWGFVPDFDAMEAWLRQMRIQSPAPPDSFAISIRKRTYFVSVWNSTWSNRTFRNLEVCKKQCVHFALDRRPSDPIDLSARLVYMWRPEGGGSFFGFEAVGEAQQVFSLHCSVQDPTLQYSWRRYLRGKVVWDRLEYQDRNEEFATCDFNASTCDRVRLGSENSWATHPRHILSDFEPKAFFNPFNPP